MRGAAAGREAVSAVISAAPFKLNQLAGCVQVPAGV